MAELTLQEQIAKLTAENNALKADKADRKLSFKVSEKGAVSVYGLSARFPVSLYGSQWDTLIANVPALKAFIDANRARLSTIEQKRAAVAAATVVPSTTVASTEVKA